MTRDETEISEAELRRLAEKEQQAGVVDQQAAASVAADEAKE